MTCNLYKVPSGLTPVTIIYTDCDGVDQPVSVPGGSDYYFCSTNPFSVPGVVEIGPCNCNLYVIPSNFLPTTITYTDCNTGLDVVLDVPDIGNLAYYICATSIFSETSNPQLVGDCNGCYCNYVVSITTAPEIGATYNDCNGVPQTITNLSNGDSFCANYYFRSNDPNAIIGRSNIPCVVGEGYECPNIVYCFNLEPNRPENPEIYTYYVDPNGSIQLLDTTGSTSICARAILTTFDANGDPTNLEKGVVTLTGLCGVDPISGEYICASENCECYVVTSRFDNTLVEYIDCNNNILTGYTSGSNSSIGIDANLIVCSKLILTPGLSFYNLGDCNTSACHISLCDCYTIPENVGAYVIIYLDCNDNVVTIENNERVNPKTSFCAKTILDDNTGLVTKGYPCIDGVCITSPPPTNPLLYTLLKLRGPCPDICSGQVKLGGITGTDEINIITQNPL